MLFSLGDLVYCWAVCFGFDLCLVVFAFMVFAVDRLLVCNVACFCLDYCGGLRLVYLDVCVGF